MSIWTDKDGRRHVGIMVEGRRVHRIMPKGATASDAKRAESALRESIGRRSVAIPGDPLLSKVMGLYIEHASNLRSAKTAKHHAYRAGPWLEGMRASDAQKAAAAMIQDMRPHYAPATINRSLSALKKALTLAWDRGAIPENYGLRIKRLQENNAREIYLTIQEVESIASKATKPVQAAIWISLFTGCRRGEILALKPEDISTDSIVIRAGNTKALKTRTIPIVTPVRPWLEFVPLPMNFEGLKTGFRRARVKAGMPHVTFHDLRRSCGTLMVQAGVDLYVISKVLGHSSMAVTQKHYAHMQIEQLRSGMEKTFG